MIQQSYRNHFEMKHLQIGLKHFLLITNIVLELYCKIYQDVSDLILVWVHLLYYNYLHIYNFIFLICPSHFENSLLAVHLPSSLAKHHIIH